MRQVDNSGVLMLLDDGSTIEFDVILSVSHSMQVEAARYPVELGVERVYSVNPMPTLLSFDARVSSVDLDEPEGSDDRDLVAWDRLQYLRNRGELFTVQTGDGSYDNMFISSLERIEDNTTTGVLSVAIDLEQAQLGMLEEVDTPARFVSNPSGARKGSSRTEDGGSKQSEVMTPEQLKERFTGRVGRSIGGF